MPTASTESDGLARPHSHRARLWALASASSAASFRGRRRKGLTAPLAMAVNHQCYQRLCSQTDSVRDILSVRQRELAVRRRFVGMEFEPGYRHAKVQRGDAASMSRQPLLRLRRGLSQYRYSTGRLPALACVRFARARWIPIGGAAPRDAGGRSSAPQLQDAVEGYQAVRARRWCKGGTAAVRGGVAFRFLCFVFRVAVSYRIVSKSKTPAHRRRGVDVCQLECLTSVPDRGFRLDGLGLGCRQKKPNAMPLLAAAS